MTLYSRPGVFFISILLLFVWACSTKKNTYINRTFHNITAKYNGYFNANEIVNEAVYQLKQNHQDNYQEILPLFIYGDESQAQGMYPQMDEAIKKCSEVIDRHSMEINDVEYCKWIDDNYLLIGKANFYKKNFTRAAELFNYVSKEYEKETIRFNALLWLARTKGEQKKYVEGITKIKTAKNDREFPEELTLEADLILADLYLKQKDYSKAVVALESATATVKNKKTKTRITFILAQIYQKRNDAEKAIRAYNKVLSLRPDYEMEFYANINQALAFNNRLNPEAIKSKLKRMLKDDKYKEFYDQIYYALADIALKERNKDEGIALLKKSAEASINNPNQKASAFLRLADIYFEDRAYEPAQQYYDSTSSLVNNSHEAYEKIITRKESLTQLVDNINTIEHQDSLQRIAQMDEDERNLFIEELLVAEQEAAEEEARAKELALQRLQNQPPVANGIQNGDWYFYNPSAMNFGKNEFIKRWGGRSLDDDWRRSNKSSVVLTTNNTPGESPAIQGQKTKEDYLQALPLSEEALDSSNALIDAALYNNGLIYKEKLNDVTNAIESFEQLTARFNNSKHLLLAYYQLYRLYLNKENSQGNNFVSFDTRSSSSYYKDKILLNYPNSEFAELIRDPNFKKEEDKVAERYKLQYEKTFSLFEKKVYNEVLVNANTAINNQPDNPFLPKYYLLKARILTVIDDKEGYKNTLEKLVNKFPNTEESELAKYYLDKMANFDPTSAVDGPVAEIEESAFNFEPTGEHYFILVFPKDQEKSKNIKRNIAEFNDRFFRNEQIKMAESFIDNDNQLMILRSFSNKENGMRYYKAFVSNTGMLSSLNKSPDFKKYLISIKNFSTLFQKKNIGEYESFFDKNYLQ